MRTLFIADLHLAEDEPRLTELFLRFLREGTAGARALHILGDLFEVWVGDDDARPFNRSITGALRALADRGVKLFVQHGNRDFLLGAGFERQTGCRLLPDPSLIDLDGTATLLMHGDLLCTDDVEYQRFRAQVRDPEAQRAFLARPLGERLATARHYREQSRLRAGGKPEAIMDVSPAAVHQTLRRHGVVQLIHGHTHRPGVHYFHLDGRLARRIVLGDWGARASVLAFEGGRFSLGDWPAG